MKVQARVEILYINSQASWLPDQDDKIMHIIVEIKEIMIYVPLPLYPSYHSSVVWPSLDLTNEGGSLIWRSEVILI